MSRSVSPHLPHHLRSLLIVQWSRNLHSPGHGSQPHGDDAPLTHSPWREERRQRVGGRGGREERQGGGGRGGRRGREGREKRRGWGGSGEGEEINRGEKGGRGRTR